MRSLEAPPRAALLIESMRDIGYSLETALSDVVDNSISAGARNIAIHARVEDLGALIAVVDDGAGMEQGELESAMRLGSRSPLEDREARDLGRFGLGLKTASFSQCRRLTVVSRASERLSGARWDLEHVARTDQWLVQIPDEPSTIPFAGEIGVTGTLVLWELLDRVMDGPTDELRRRRFNERMSEVATHLELVFHRFLAGEVRGRKIRIQLNGRDLGPLDPFHQSHPATIRRPEERIALGGEHIRVQAFTLPHHSKVSDEEWKRHALPGGYLKNQGFYLYREHRLIMHGTWFGLTKQAELTKLARVRIDMSNGLDSAWKIDVKKASAQPPGHVRERLKRIIDQIAGGSVRVYTGRGARSTRETLISPWSRTKKQGQVTYSVNREHPRLAALREVLHGDTRAEFDFILRFLGAALPLDAIFADMGDNPEGVGGEKVSTDALRELVVQSFETLRAGGLAARVIRQMLRGQEPFRSNWPLVESMLDSLGQENGDAV